MNQVTTAIKPPQEVAFREAKLQMLVDDVTGICQRVPFIEVAPAHLFSDGLLSEIADASDRLAVAVSKIQERRSADR